MEMELMCKNLSQILLPSSSWKREPLEKLITEFGYIISSMAISIHIFIHFTTDLFQNFPGHLLVSNCILLFIQYCFSMSFLILEGDDSVDALFDKKLLKVGDYYVTVYIWSVLTRVQFAMAFDLWKCLRTETINMRFAKQQTAKFFKYSIICWFSPFAEWSLLWILVRFFRTFLKKMLCPVDSFWVVFMLYFAVDFFLMIANVSLYIFCFYYIYRTKSSVKSDTHQSSNFWYYFKICGRLFIMSEVNYTLLILTDHFHFYTFRTIFNNFMAYHGAVVFTTIILKKSMLKPTRSFKSETENTGLVTVTSSNK